ncbi:MAG: hypothetical protein K2M30_00210 [Desulfovibrionaceae bacterium]|nr:hypothetical protein [Desulfovibrionaceae bacterium]
MKYSHIALYFLSIFVFFGCSSISSSTNQELSLGVVDFYQPTGLHELFAGKLFPYRTEATKEEEKDLSAILYEELEKKTSYKVQHLSLSHTQGTDETPLEYWSSLGSSQNLDLLIIPQIMEWKEGEYVREEYLPPKVVIEYYLVDVKEKKVLERSRYYDEYMNTEYDLRYNTPANGMFFGKRPSRMDLAVDSIYKMLIDFSFVRNRKEKNIFAQ